MTKPQHPQYKSNMTATVSAIGEMQFDGLTLPETWFNVITNINGKPDIDAILLLAEIVSWYQPLQSRCPQTGRLIGYKRRFPLHKLKRSYKELGEKFALSTKRTADAISRLAAMQLITVEQCRNGDNKKAAEGLFFEPVVENIRYITSLSQTMPSYDYQSATSTEAETSAQDQAPKPQKRSSSIGFETFWKAYPEGFRDSRTTMFNLWQRRGLDQESEHIIQDVLTRKQQDGNWVEQVIPRMQTYLNQRRWEADVAPLKPQQTTVTGNAAKVTNPLSQSYYHEQMHLAHAQQIGQHNTVNPLTQQAWATQTNVTNPSHSNAGGTVYEMETEHADHLADHGEED